MTAPAVTVARGAARPAALAGTWYSADPTELRRDVQRYLEAAQGRLSSRAQALQQVAMVVAPHGLMYSGRTAGAAWAMAPPHATRIVMIGPAHRMAFSGVALGDFACFRVPGAEIAVDQQALAQLETRHPDLMAFVPGAHDDEHCLEIQLPFAAVALPGRPIVPLLVGRASSEALAEALEGLLMPTDLLVISTDLSHFNPQAIAKARDLATLTAINHLEAAQLDGYDACGYRGVLAAAIVARSHGYRATLLDYSNSGDSGGDPSSVVGYGAMAFGPPA